jgi:type I restriction enzyme R subunit
LAPCRLGISHGVAIREYPLAAGHGFADYILYVHEQVVGAPEAKKEGIAPASYEVGTEKYATGVPENLPVPIRPLPFIYQSTGVETHFTNGFDPLPRRREFFAFHRPETLREWLEAEASLRARLQAFPKLDAPELWPAQLQAVANLPAHCGVPYSGDMVIQVELGETCDDG